MESGPGRQGTSRAESAARKRDVGPAADGLAQDGKRPSSSSQTLTEVGDQERPWYEGLTAQERADAKRRYKNRKGVERWRRRKQAQRAKEKEGSTQSQPWSASQSLRESADGSSGSRGLGQEQRPSVPPKPELLQDGAASKTEIQGQKGSESGSSGSRTTAQLDKSGSSTTPSSDEVVIPERLQTGNMLYEFQKLGKANEVKMKAVLDTLASYAMIPHGFQRHKGRVVRLAEAALNIARSGGPSTQEIAQLFLSWGIKFNSAWEDPEIPNFQQIIYVFAKGEDTSTYVKVALPGGNMKSVTLRQLSQFDEAVHKELYIGLVNQILREIPQAMQKSPAAQKAKGRITKQMKQASMVASGYIIGQFVSFTSQRAIRKNLAVPMQGMMYAAASLGLQNDACKQLWQIWDATKVKLQPLLDKHQVLEQRLDSLLVLHDINTDGSYNAIFDAVEQLMRSFEEQFGITYYADLVCSHGILNPLQMGLLAAAQVPKLPVRQILAENIDPYPRISIVFESGVVPRHR